MAEIRSLSQSQNCPSGNSVRHYRLRRYASDATTPSFVVLKKAMPKRIFDFEMEKVINLGIPHVGEQIFASIETQELVQSLQISENHPQLCPGQLCPEIFSRPNMSRPFMSYMDQICP